MLRKLKTKLWIISNILKFRYKGISFGSKLRVSDKVYIKRDKSAIIRIGNNFSFTSGGGYNPISSNVKGYLRVDKDATLSIGNDCGMSSTTLWVKKSVTIGNHVLVGGGCLIMDTDCHSLDWQQRGCRGGIDRQGRYIDALNAKCAPVVIENDVLIGARSIVLKGVTIGARSVIGAGSVVSQSIPADSIAAGNPCKVIKKINR